MRREQEMVRAFHAQAGALIQDRPAMPSADTRDLRLNLITEELDELNQALWPDDGVYDHGLVADALGDLLYVVLGTAVSCGIDIEPIFHEIHRSNMTKFIDGHRREDGKWIKGPSYEPANLGPLIEQQCHD